MAVPVGFRIYEALVGGKKSEPIGKRKNHTPEQIVRKLREADRLSEAGNSVDEVARQIGVSSATVYNWRKRYGSMGIDEVKELHRLKEENARLKRLVADKELEVLAFKEVAEDAPIDQVRAVIC